MIKLLALVLVTCVALAQHDNDKKWIEEARTNRNIALLILVVSNILVCARVFQSEDGNNHENQLRFAVSFMFVSGIIAFVLLGL